MSYSLSCDTWNDEEVAALSSVIDSGMFTCGSRVKKFEEEFAEYMGAKYAVMVNSGSSANLLAAAAIRFHPELALNAGDEVIVPTVSWSTTYYPLVQHGLTLRFVDIDRETLNLDLAKLEAAITPKTKAVFAVHLLGNPCDMDVLQDICKRHDLVLLEDTCESMGAKFDGKHLGTFGLCGTFSTFYSHHLCTMEGGLIVTDDERMYHILISMRSHGWTRGQPEHSHLKFDVDPFSDKFRFVLPGYNVRPLELQGALGTTQLMKLPELVSFRRRNAEVFRQELQGLATVQIQRELGESSWFGFSMILQQELAGRRAEVVARFDEAKIECRPIVCGNFLNNPVIKHLPHTISGDAEVAEDVDKNGLFVGNHQEDLGENIRAVSAILRSIV